MTPPKRRSASAKAPASAKRRTPAPSPVHDRLRLAQVRHDLRTPINHILGYSEMLLEEAQERAPTEFLRDLRRIRRGGEELLGLITQYLSEEVFFNGPRDLHSLCHELRTPVNHILGYGELLTEQCDELGLSPLKPDLARIIDAGKTWLALMESELIGETTGKRANRSKSKPSSNTEVLERIERKLVQPLLPEQQLLSAQQGRLLVADDDEGNRELLRRQLTKLGYEVTACSNGRDALQRLESEPFDLALLDMLMPSMDGYEVLTRLKAHPMLQHLPVIMLSALDHLEGIVRCIELGAEDYVAKPFNPVFLRARIGAALEKKRLRDWEQIYLKQIEAERAKSERLLLNVLPRPIADRLRHGDGMIADHFPEVTVLFADLVGFTTLSARLPPTVVVQMLNEIFSAFDELAATHGLEKIKTIGDAYMAVAGLPLPRPDHAHAAAQLALGMQAALRRYNQSHNLALHMRIGLNSGPVIAGVIGQHKFAYDLWGDTVNIASRMEALAESDRILVTEATRQRLRAEHHLEAREPLEVKGKGTMTTYYLVETEPAPPNPDAVKGDR